jgi:hypothetical protein
MWQHIERIEVVHEVTEFPGMVSTYSPKPNPLKNVTASSLWDIHITGDLEQDNPDDAIEVLHELQEQIERIRKAYGYDDPTKSLKNGSIE